MDALAGNASPKVHWNLHPLRSLAMMRSQSISLWNLLLLSIQKKICKKSSGQSLKLKLSPRAAPVKSHWRLNYLTSIVVSPTWKTITSANSARITLPPPEPRAPIALLLQHLFYVTASTSIGSSTSGNMRPKAKFLSLEKSLKTFFVKA